MPAISLVISSYNGGSVLENTIPIILNQPVEDMEIIIVDDCSDAATLSSLLRVSTMDKRIKVLYQDENKGTFCARRRGVLKSKGNWVLLMDQDDSFASDAFDGLLSYASKHEAEIYHFGAKVVAANAAAKGAAEGMQSFLIPIPRRIEGDEILRVQLAENEGFDWHIHHKMILGDLARRVYGLLPEERLVYSDDIYTCFALCAVAHSYEAIPNSPWYIYNLGTGDTFGSKMDIEHLKRLSCDESRSVAASRAFSRLDEVQGLRSDWDSRVEDQRDRQIFHIMNEWKDGIAKEEKREALSAILDSWSDEAVCGELYRYVRDYAYSALMAKRAGEIARYKEQGSEAVWYYELTTRIEGNSETNPSDWTGKRYLQMRDIANAHLNDAKLLNTDADDGLGQESQDSAFKRLMKLVLRR